MDRYVISHVHSEADPVHAMLERKNLWSLVIDSDTRHQGLGMRQRKARADMGFEVSQKADRPCETTESSTKLRTKVLAARKKRKDMLAHWRTPEEIDNQLCNKNIQSPVSLCGPRGQIDSCGADSHQRIQNAPDNRKKESWRRQRRLWDARAENLHAILWQPTREGANGFCQKDPQCIRFPCFRFHWQSPWDRIW